MNVRRARWALPLAAALLGVAAFAAFASDTFTDVPSSAYYHDEVNALLNAGITAGCGGLHYCPNRAVTRGEMALFLNRLQHEVDICRDALRMGPQADVDLRGPTQIGYHSSGQCQQRAELAP